MRHLVGLSFAPKDSLTWEYRSRTLVAAILSKILKLFSPSPELRKKPQELGIKEVAPGQLTLRADNVEISVSLPFPDFSDRTPPPPIVLDGPACPYCGAIQEPPPQRRKKCRDCGETIHTWTNQESRRRYLLTKTDDERVRREQWDAEWEAASLRVEEGIRSGDWHTVKVAHFQQALMLFKQGSDHQRLAAESRKSELRYYRNMYQGVGITRVAISTVGDACCSECSSLHGKEFSIEEALESMPIPVKTCQTWVDKNQYGGWCRCSYDPIMRV